MFDGAFVVCIFHAPFVAVSGSTGIFIEMSPIDICIELVQFMLWWMLENERNGNIHTDTHTHRKRITRIV